MRVLIIGGDGMLGHQLLRHFGAAHEARVTLHRDESAYTDLGLFTPENAWFGVDVCDEAHVREIVAGYKPDGVINAAGLVKQRPVAKEVIPSVEINVLFPHRLARICETSGARLLHVSTDCVFSGKKGNYTEDDPTDAEDLYGKTKFLGELHEPHCVTFRTSIIGTELSRRQGLVEWFLGESGRIRGFTRAIFSGVTTIELARAMERTLLEYRDLSGLWHLAARSINKYDLLSKLAKCLKRTDIEIEPYDDFECDRSLNSDRLRSATGYVAPDWDTMLGELAQRIAERDRK